MALDATARESNYRDSIKKYFVDSIETGENIPVTFDEGLVAPDLFDRTVEKWVAVNFGPLRIGKMSNGYLSIHCCTRRDNEGFKLAQLKDKILGYLSDESTTDSFRRIPFYQSALKIANWSLIGSLIIVEITESGQMKADDETKYKTLDVQIRFASKI